jgi:hypothetical protein
MADEIQIVFPKPHGLGRAPSVSDSFAAGDNSYYESPRDGGHNQMGTDDEVLGAQANPPVVSPPEYGLETPQMNPRLVRSLMHRRVSKIASGGVHNICVVEPNPQTTVAQDIYLMNFVQARYTDVTFKGFYSTQNTASASSHGNTDHGDTHMTAHQ